MSLNPASAHTVPAHPEHIRRPFPVLVEDDVMDPQDGSFATDVGMAS
jgi:hypothetical protein